MLAYRLQHEFARLTPLELLARQNEAIEVLTAAVEQLQAEVESLRGRVDALGVVLSSGRESMEGRCSPALLTLLPSSLRTGEILPPSYRPRPATANTPSGRRPDSEGVPPGNQRYRTCMDLLISHRPVRAGLDGSCKT